MSNESKEKILLCVLFWVLFCTHAASSQTVNSIYHSSRPPVITTYTDYKNSIVTNQNKRIVSLDEFISPLFTDWKYATADNFTGQILYVKPEAYVRKVVADSLKKIQEELSKKNLGLLFFDAYRPYSVTEKMWKIVPDERYAANPAQGSGHNRGIAVDVTLVEIPSGKKLIMPTPFDDFTEKAHHNYMQLSKEVLENRNLLKTTMEKHSFTALATEWWHYSLSASSTNYELLDLDFKTMKEITLTQK